jgi:hypothetical protein
MRILPNRFLSSTFLFTVADEVRKPRPFTFCQEINPL